jgi:chemotaxis protein MotA
MDIATIIGIVGGFGMLVLSIIMGGMSISLFIDIPSLILVVLGPPIMMFVFGKMSEMMALPAALGKAFKPPVFNQKGVITKLMTMSEKARREGLLALEEELEDLDDEFLKKGLRLVVDGTDAEVIDTLLSNEITQLQTRHARAIGLVAMWATLGPGTGMLGTVMGLVVMLSNLSDKASLGPNMAVALITTFYGSIVANLLMIPWGGKLTNYDAEEAQVMTMELEGILSIQSGDNPRILGQKMLTYLTPKDRKSVEAEILKD